MTTIKLKNGSGAPTAGNLVQGEPALDLTNKRLYTENSSGAVIEVGTNPTSVTTGTVTADTLDIDDLKILSGQSTTPTNLSSPLIYRAASHSDYANGDLLLQPRSNASRDIYMLTGTTTPVNRLQVNGNGDISFYEDTGATAKFFWDASAESLGIGTTSPSSVLHLSTSNDPQITLTDTGFGASADITGSNGNLRLNSQTATIFDMADSEVMRLDSSGNFLVGKTATGIGTAGAELKSTGELLATVNNDACAFLNRKSSDGDIAQFRKDNTTVGSIATQNGEICLMADSGGGIRVRSAMASVIPVNENRTNLDNTTDLGSEDARFKSLYLSGDLALTESFVFGNTDGLNLRANSGKFISMQIAGGEKARIDSSGNLLVGTTDTNPANDASGTGVAIGNGGWVAAARDGDTSGMFNRLTSNGNIVTFQRDGVNVFTIGTSNGSYPYLAGGASGSTQAGIRFINDQSIRPCNSSGLNLDNSLDLGASNARFKILYLSGAVNLGGDVLPTTDAGLTGHSDLGDPAKRFEDAYVRDGVTVGSDRRDKQDIEELSDAEQRVAVACKGLLRKWRWIDAVEAKGDDARIHFGIIAQDLQDAFTAEGLDAGRYAMFINSTWTDEETGEERSRMGVRYSELLAFIIAAI